MLTMIRESKGFTLVELMIVVAIIGILAAVAVPYYQRYVQKAKLQKFVFPTLRMYQTNITTHFAVQSTFPDGIVGAEDADTAYISDSTFMVGSKKLVLTIRSGIDNQLQAFSGKQLTSLAVVRGTGKLVWYFGSTGLAQDLGLK